MDGAGYYGWGWTGFREIIMQWQQIGVFDVVLPLLLVFTVVYAILDKIGILGDNKAINIIISLVLAFFAVSNVYVSGFFMYLFSYTGIGIAILLAAVVLLGLFAKKKRCEMEMDFRNPRNCFVYMGYKPSSLCLWNSHFWRKLLVVDFK